MVTPMRAVVLVILLATAACGQRDPNLTRLQERLKSRIDDQRPDSTRDDVQQALTRQLRKAPVRAGGRTSGSSPVFPTRQTLAKFYAEKGYRLAWYDPSGAILPAVSILLDTLRRAGEHGLNPEDYALGQLDSLESEARKPGPEGDAAARLADFDLLLTASFLRYASDLSSGRVHPDEIRDDWQ